MAMDSFSVKADYIARLQSILSDPFYKDATENSASYNTRLCMERKMRLPFLDAQTGVAQSDCSLWMQKWQRMPGQTEGQLYTYPARRWRKKKRQYLMNDFYLTRRIRDVDMNETEGQIGILDNSSSRMEDGESGEKAADDSKDSWYQEFEETAVEIPDVGDVEDPESDIEDYEEAYARKKRKKVRSTRGRKRADRFDYTDMEKPYSCEICGARYKTRPGLSYHYTHGHNNDSTDNTEEETNYVPPKPTAVTVHAPPPPPVPVHPVPQPTSSAFTWMSAPAEEPAPMPNWHMLNTNQNQSTEKDPGFNHNVLSRKPTSGSSPSPYCDFCLGDSNENKKTRLAEELVSCSDCGRSAHPTCLQFTPNMTLSVKKYRWQCIECKSCGLCGTSDNDDQLLFCDDCDRGYHMYCLNPPLSEPPEGSWSCHLCIEEYGRK